MNVHVEAKHIDGRLAPKTGKMLGARGGLRPTYDVRPASAATIARQVRAKNALRYQLRHPSGVYVNIDLSGEAHCAANGWIGSGAQLEAVRRLRPDLAAYAAVPIFPEGTGGIWLEGPLRSLQR